VRLQIRTLLLLLLAVSVLLAANAVSLRVPFDDGYNPPGFMLKFGWPCSFYERTGERIFWESNDLAADVAVCLGLLAIVAFASEFTLRRRWNYGRFILIAVLEAILLGCNLHERIDGVRIVRGFPFRALINGPYELHHNRIELSGLAADLLFAVAATAGAWFLTTALYRRRAAGLLAP
jgi:hypothetical protein